MFDFKIFLVFRKASPKCFFKGFWKWNIPRGPHALLLNLVILSNHTKIHPLWSPPPFLHIYHVTTLFLKACLSPLRKWQLRFQWACIDLICRPCGLCCAPWNSWWRWETKLVAFRSPAWWLRWFMSPPVTCPGSTPPPSLHSGLGVAPASGWVRPVEVTDGSQREGMREVGVPR